MTRARPAGGPTTGRTAPQTSPNPVDGVDGPGRPQSGRFARIPADVVTHPNLTPTAVRVYAALALYADAAGKCWPARSTLATELGVTRSTVDRAIQALLDAKVITRRRRRDKAGDPTSNEYRIRGGSPTDAATRLHECSHPEGGCTDAATQLHGCGHGSRTDAATVAAGMQHELEPIEGDQDEAAAAAAADPGPTDPPNPPGDVSRPPVAVDILLSKLRAHTRLAGLRGDRLTPAQHATLEALIALHGDAPLVDAALHTLRDPAPVSVAAFIGTWLSLPKPGQRLAVVRQTLCDTHELPLSSAGVCRSCEADRKAAQ